MRLLICEWTAYMQEDLEACLHQFGIETVEYGYRWIGSFEEDAYFARNFRTILEREKDSIDGVMSLNYMAPLAILCAEIEKPYIAWVYDCPFGLMHPERTLGLPTNYVFFFDRTMADGFRSKGFKSVFHLPLAVNVARLDEVVSVAGNEYAADVSFVGNLYGNQFAPLRNGLPEKEGECIDRLIQAQSAMYGTYILENELSNMVTPLWQWFYPDVREITSMEFHTFLKWVEHTIAKEITRRERLAILAILSRRVHTCLYSPYMDDRLSEVDYRGVVSAYDEAPKVYYNSKINLNITLKDLTSGVPLRALEIMGSGGFLLSNRQPEIAENFVDGEEVVFYESIEEAVGKTLYYLEHDEERRRIATCGRKAVERFSFENQVGEILKTVFSTFRRM